MIVQAPYICQMSVCFKVLSIIAISVTMATCQSSGSGNISLKIASADSILNWMEGVDAFYFSYGCGDSTFLHFTQGLNSDKRAADSLTIYEGASLSKTLTAYIYWNLARNDNNIKLPYRLNDTCSIKPLDLLQHRIPMDSSVVKSCMAGPFRYSEDNYLLLQKKLEQQSGKDLQQLADEIIFSPLQMKRSSFVWKHPSNFVNGAIDKNKAHRNIYRFDKPRANGTLYTCGSDMEIFIKAFIKTSVMDSILSYQTPVKGYNKLFWGAGMGIEKNELGTWLWQWGSNWSYNHILLINPEKKTWLLIMSNSIWGAKRIRQCSNKFFKIEFQAFNSINWY